MILFDRLGCELAQADGAGFGARQRGDGQKRLGFVKHKTAEGLSQRTVDSYEWVLRKWMEKIGDQPVGKITSADVLDYMTYLRTEYVPRTFVKLNNHLKSMDIQKGV
ncbi:MAG: phage integrase N-terminal SAM-like domain-containing protein [Anaerolineaceae bacterium]|nr:phage integrase N-terminal SAM-like domain-containing protein [Anaerolineaceae bacterium]